MGLLFFYTKMKRTIIFLALLAGTALQAAETEIPHQQCKVLLNIPGDAHISKDNGGKTVFNMDELFDGKWMSGFQKYAEVGWRYFGWDRAETHHWFTFDIGEYAKLSKIAVMPYYGFTNSDPTSFELWAFAGQGEVPEQTAENWYESDTRWVKVARGDASLLNEQAKKLLKDSSLIGIEEFDPCVRGYVVETGNCCTEIPSARYYRFRMINNFYGVCKQEVHINWKQFINRCTISELRLWKDDNPTCSNKNANSFTPGPTKVRDLMLHYCGGPRDQMKYKYPKFLDYLMTDEKRPRWLFDGTLLLQQYPDNENSYYGMGMKKIDGKNVLKNPATREQIELLWKDWFSIIIPRLESDLNVAKQKVAQPFHKHKLVLMLSVVQKFEIENYSWGEVDGISKADWNSWETAKAAYIWQIESLISQFEEGKFENIELLGFYWPQEDGGISIYHTKELADYIHNRGYQFHFIPYFNKGWFTAPIYSVWKDCGFDFSYLQPNYFFKKTVPYSRLPESCKLAEKFGMDMEMEFSPSNQPDNLDRMEDYMNVFDSCGVFKNSNIAYFQSNCDFSKLKAAKEEDKYKYSLYKRLCNYVAERHKRFYKD